MATETESSAFPAADVEKELDPSKNKDFETDSVSSDIDATKEIKERDAVIKKKKEVEKKNNMQSLRTTFIVSAVILALAAAAMAITNKLKQQNK
ncbi:uncharacterized protein [Euphorbia lathyris]|uniref:uncharacterized protein n=1 Tax=Euphorbia lathyris TaxID=212925 RepID=UPI00331318BA